MLERTNQLGGIVAIAIFLLYIALFVFRLLDRAALGHRIASIQFLAVLPLAYLLFTARHLERPTLYYIQISLFLVFLLVEFLLDYLLKVDFRQVRWMVISYVTLFFAATGGLLGIAATTGRTWTITSGLLFLVMAILAFVQRAVTGM